MPTITTIDKNVTFDSEYEVTLCSSTQDFIDHVSDSDHIDIIVLNYWIKDNNILIAFSHMLSLISSGKLSVGTIFVTEKEPKEQHYIANKLQEYNIDYKVIDTDVVSNITFNSVN